MEKEIFTSPDPTHQINYKRKKKVPVTFLSFNPQGTALAVVDNQISKTRITLKDLETGASKKIFRQGFKNNVQATDLNYPKVSWLPDGSGLFIIYEDRDKITLELRDFANGTLSRQFLPERYERVYSMAAISAEELVFTALSEGMIDIYHYTTRNRQSNRLTQDIYDDLDLGLATIDGVDGLLFSSNRPDAHQSSESVDTILPFKNFNLFHLAFEEEGPKLYQITNQTEVNYRQPKVSQKGIMYISDESGIINRKEALVTRVPVNKTQYLLKDSTIILRDLNAPAEVADSLILAKETIEVIEYHEDSYFLTNNLWNTLTYDVDPNSSKVAEAYKIKDQYKVILSDPGGSTSISNSLHHEMQDKKTEGEKMPAGQSERVTEAPVEEVIRSRRSNEDGKKYLFQSEYGDMETDQTERILENAVANQVVLNTTITSRAETEVDSQPINRLRIVPYRTKFKLYDLSTNMDNNLLFGGLDSYAGFKEGFEPTPLGILMKAKFKDLFEDFEFEGGMRIPTSFNGSEFFLVHDDKKKRIDKQYALYRKSLTENVGNNDPIRARSTVLLGQFGVRYPLDIYNSVRATATLRQDKTTFLASDQQSLNNPDLESQRIGLKLEYVFDNAIEIDYNIRSGTRFKLSTEVLKKFAFNLDPISLKLSEGFMTVLSTDARHYLHFAKHMVWATRFAAATSFGSEKILYFLGGVDNWLIPKYSDEVGQPAGNFAFQTISPNLRGFDYNIRNGSTFALINTELRIPFLKYLSRRPIKFSFLRNMQLVGFADVGTAWEGLSPFDEENPINILNLYNPPTVAVRVNYYKDPLVFGYGVGFRTVLFGYFIRADYAWGVETRIVQKPKIHLALGFDF
jgi:hypothetical protein